MSRQRICWLHHCSHKSEKQMQTDYKFTTRKEKTLMSDSSRLQSSTGRPVALGHSESERDIAGILEEQRQQLLSEAHSEILMQERRAEKAEADTREPQQQIHPNQMEFRIFTRTITEPTSTTSWNVISTRTSIARSSYSRSARNGTTEKESGKSDWRIIPTMFERKSVYGERNYGSNEWAQERVNCMSDSREFQEADSVCSGRLSHVPTSPAFILSPQSMPSRDQSLRKESS